MSDVDSNLLALSIEQSDHGKLTRNCDGTYTYTPKHGYVGTDVINYTVSDGSLTDSGRITINVVRSGNNCASIIVRSSDPNVQPVTINWNASASDFVSQPVSQQAWLSAYFGTSEATPTLGDLTGLVVRI